MTSTKNVTIVLTSHSVNDLQGIATHIGILDRGKLLKVVDRNELLQKTRQFLKLRVDDVKKASFLLEQNLQITDYKVLEDDTLLIYEQSEHAAAIARTLITNNLEVSELTISKSSIEDYIVKLKNEGSY